MKNNNLNKLQLLIWLMLLVSMRISYVNAEQPSKVSYQQWKSEQQSQDRQLKKAPTTNTTSSSHYLSKPALSSASNSQKIGGVSKSMLFILTALYKTMINVKETQIKSFYMIQNFLRKTAGSSYCSLYSMS